MNLLQRITGLFRREQLPSNNISSVNLLYQDIVFKQNNLFDRLELCVRDSSDSERRNGFYKTVKLLKIVKVPQQLRERESLLGIHAEVLSGLWVNNIVFINIIANIINNDRGRKGLLFLYGVEGTGSTLEESIISAEEGYASLTGLLKGNFKQLRFEDLTMGDFSEIFSRMEGFKRLMVVRGIPAAKSGMGTSTQSELGFNNSKIEEVNEEFLRGLIDEEYLMVSISVPIDYGTLNFWIHETARKLSKWKSDVEGMKSITAGVSIPFMMIGMLGRQMGNSYQEASSITSTNSTADSISEMLTTGETSGVTQGESILNSISTTEGTNESHAISSGFSDSLGNNMGFSKGNNYSEGNQINHSDNVTNSHTNGSSTQESNSYSTMNSQTNHHSITHSQSQTRSHSETHGVGQNINFSTNWGKNISNSSSLGESWQNNISTINSQTNSSSMSDGISNSVGKTSYDNFYQTSFSKPPKMQTCVWNSGSGWNAGAGLNAGIDVIGGAIKGGYNKSQGFAEGFRQINNSDFMDFYRDTKDFLPQGQMNNPYKVFTPKDVMGTMSNDIPFGAGYTLYQGNPITNSVTNNITNSVGEAITNGVNISNGLGGNVVNSIVNGVSRNLGITTGFSRQQSVTDGWSVTQGVAETFGTSQTTGVSEGMTQGNSQTITNGTSNGYSDGYSNTNSTGGSSVYNTGNSINRGSTYSSSFSNGTNQSTSSTEGTTKMNSTSHQVSTQETKGTTQTESRGNSIGLVSGFGFNRGINAGLSSSFGLAPSIMISHSRREFDEARENISRLYGSLKERLLVGLNTGIFSTSTYIMTPDNLVASKAKALIKSAFLNNELLSPIQILEPKEETEEYLRQYLKTFGQCTLPEEDSHPTETYKYCQTLLPRELAAFNHPPRVEIGGIYTTVENIPDSFALPSDRLGKIEIGTIISPETGESSIFRFGLTEDEIVHTSIYGITGSGKTNGALQYITQIANNFKDININIFDFKNDWRNLYNSINDKDRFRFFSLYNEKLHPFRFNPLRVPKGLDAEEWKDTITEVFCLENLLGEKQFGIIDQAIYKLYEDKGVFDDPDKSSFLSSKITLVDLYNLLKQESGDVKSKNLLDSYYGILIRLRKFTNKKSRLFKLYSTPYQSIKVENLFNKNYITIFEGQRLDHQTKKFILGLVAAAEYKYSLAYPTDNLSRMIVFEEAHEIIKGSDSIDSPIKETSIYEKMFMECRGLGTMMVIIAQNMSMIPLTVRQNCPNLFIFKLTNEEDLKLVMRSIGRDERIDHRDIIRYIANKGIGYSTVKIGNVTDYLKAQPVEVLFDYQKITRISDNELKNIPNRI